MILFKIILFSKEHHIVNDIVFTMSVKHKTKWSVTIDFGRSTSLTAFYAYFQEI